MHRIITLTVNPAIDEDSEAELVRPIHKIRTKAGRYEPGGGGINVARVIDELGGAPLAVYLSGGITGPILDELILRAGIQSRRVLISEPTRISHNVRELSTGQEYRFVPEGPLVGEAEWRACLDILRNLRCDYLVASGSLPRGVPLDFYEQVARIAAGRGMRFVLDSSGEALRNGLWKEVYLFKPSLGELETLVGQKLHTHAEQEKAMSELVRSGAAEMIALTLGREGAVVATAKEILRIDGIDLPVKSAVGAGDAFLAAMVFALAEGRSLREAVRHGVAAGTAVVMTAGMALCRREDVQALDDRLRARDGQSASRTPTE